LGENRDPKRALRLQKLSAAQGYSKGENRLGDIYRDAGDYPAALHWLKLAAQQGDPDAEADYGWMFVAGVGVKENYSQSSHWFKLSAAQGNLNGEYDLGNAYQYGYGVKQDYGQAMRLDLLAAAQGETTSMCEIGQMYEAGLGVTRDYGLAMQWYRRSANGGDDCGYDAVGFLYDQGLGVPVDEVRALQWWIVPARHGDDTAENNIGAMYHRGVGGLPLDYTKAAYWFKLAAAKGDATAEANLAVLTTDGLGVRQSDAAAFKLDRLAAKQDEPHAEEHLGSIYRLGRATPVDYTTSAKYYAQAAEHGLSQSQAALSYLLENGLGVKRDRVAAYKWYLISGTVKQHPIMVDDVRCREYSELPVSDLADIFKDLTLAQKAAAQTQADAWLAAHPASGAGQPPPRVQQFF